MISEQVNYTSLYTEDELNELKTNMEIEIGATISKVRYYSRKSQKTTDVRFVCKERKGHGCPFQYVFQEIQHGRFALLSHQHEHQNLCYFDDETKAFLYSRSRLIKMKPLIEDFVHRRDALRLHERPLVLLTLMNREFGDGEGNFFECGVASQESKTKLKKKFDNIVNEIRFARRKESQSNTNSDVASKSSLKSEKQVALPLTVPETSPKVKEQQKKCGFISTATTLDEPTSTEADVKRLTAFTPVKAERPQYLGFPSATVLESPFQPYFIYNGLLTPFPTAYAFPFPYYN